MKKIKINIYADGANENEMYLMNRNKNISGMTTNPTLMKNSGIKDYKNFALINNAFISCYLDNKKVEEKGLAYLIVAKQRSGPTRTVKATFIDTYARFENYTDWSESENVR